MPVCFLVDNGSLRAASTLNLRKVAAAVEQRTGQPIVPSSLLHSSKVDPAELEGIPAETLERAMRRRLEEGEEEFVVLPLFFGPSLAITDYLPKRLEALRQKYPRLKVEVASCLFDSSEGTDLRLARILAERIGEVRREDGTSSVVVVDHGSPAAEVTYVRNFVAGQVSALLGQKVRRVAAASMERRTGDEYRFNEPLLETALGREGFNHGHVVVSMMFLSPGRHAGEGGDVSEICRRAEAAHPGLRTSMTRLVGDHPLLVEILADRLKQVWTR